MRCFEFVEGHPGGRDNDPGSDIPQITTSLLSNVTREPSLFTQRPTISQTAFQVPCISNRRKKSQVRNRSLFAMTLFLISGPLSWGFLKERKPEEGSAGKDFA